MAVKKLIPCSIYDIRGIQEWLDELALQGLFLEEVSPRFDRAEFAPGDPAPVRYRLDPIVKNGEANEEHKELYAQMGWTYVGQAGRSFHIFSCGDPTAPELYSDPQSLALAMDSLVRRNIRNNLLVALVALFLLPVCILVFPSPAYSLRNLLLWEHPQEVFLTALYLALMIICLPMMALEVRRLQKLRNNLAQGLPIKAGRRWNRPPWYVTWLLIFVPIQFIPRLLFPSIGWEVQGLDEAVLSHPWPTIVQTEGAGPRPLAPSPAPYSHGYAEINDSWFAPIQEYVSTDWETRPSDGLWTGVRYVQARSPKIAELIYRLERDKEVRYHEKALTYPNANRITEVQPFQSWDWSGLDKAELARYHRRGQDVWTLLLLRGNDVLMLEYSGFAQPEDCLPLFLEALDKEVTP